MLEKIDLSFNVGEENCSMEILKTLCLKKINTGDTSSVILLSWIRPSSLGMFFEACSFSKKSRKCLQV